MPAEIIVLDASVVVKWFHEEEGTARAAALQEKIAFGEVRAIVPPLIFYEVANVLTLKAGSEIEGVVEAMIILDSFPFQVVEVDRATLEDAIRIARQHGLSVYDAIYVALASLAGATLITADKKLVNAIDLPTVQIL